MRNLGKFNSDADIQNAINSGKLLNPYIAITGSNEIYTFDYNKKTPIKKYSFGGLEIAPGPLYYGSNGWEIKDSWNYDSYNSVYGKNEGSYYFNFFEMGELFEKQGFTTSDGSIENISDPLNEWRLPTRAEFCTLTTGESPGIERDGSSVNGNVGSKYAIIQLTGVTHCGSSTPVGLLLFPDGETITGKILSGINNTTCTNSVTSEELQEYLNQGCVFLPASGYYYTGPNNTWFYGASVGRYWSSTEYNNRSNGYYALFNSSNIRIDDYSKSNCYLSIRLVKSIN